MVNPGYKQTEVGVIPEDWEVKALGSFAALKNGYAFKSSTYTEIGHLRIITIANVQDGYMTIRDCNAIATEPKDLQPHQRLQIGDILISMTGNVGRVCRVAEKNCLMNQRVGKLVPQSVDTAFFYNLLTQPTFIKAMIGVAKGGAQTNLSVPEILSHFFVVPTSLPEQEAIASALSDADPLIESLQKLLTKKRQIKQGAMQELLTGKKRLPGFSGEWEMKKLGDIIARFSTGLNPRQNFRLNAGGNLFYVTIKNFESGKLFLDEECDLIDDEAFHRINERSDLQKDDILFSSIGRVGDAYLIKETPQNWNINESVFTLRPDKAQVKPLMLFYILTANAVKDALGQGVTGSTFKSIKQAQLKLITCRLPSSLSEQTAIAEVLSDMDAEIEALETKLAKARHVRQGMMQELLTGRIRLV